MFIPLPLSIIFKYLFFFLKLYLFFFSIDIISRSILDASASIELAINSHKQFPDENPLRNISSNIPDSFQLPTD